MKQMGLEFKGDLDITSRRAWRWYLRLSVQAGNRPSDKGHTPHILYSLVVAFHCKAGTSNTNSDAS
jgi:hypothetical protein